MKKALLLSFALMLVASLAFAQAGSVGIFADPQGLSCNLVDQVPAGVKQYYVVHVYTTGATASQYRAKVPTCMTGTGAMYLADTNLFGVTIGNSQTGVAVAYGACMVGPINTQIISVFGMGLTPACCRWVVDGDPAVGQVSGADCAFIVFNPTGGQAMINPTSGCQCSIPTEDTTWGQVKALYGE
jgi:hypothetical protein